jgi:general L-amino acid transport system permease protein
MSDAMSFVRTNPTAPRPAPVFARGAIAWARGNLFAGWTASILTILSIAFVLWALPGLVRYLFIDAIWNAPDGAACRAPGAGACWAFVAQKLDFFRYGSYPSDQRWRVDLTLIAGAVLIARLLWPAERRGILDAILFVLIVPLGAVSLSPGLGDIWRETGRDLALLGFGIVFAATIWFARIATSRVALMFFLIYPVVAYFLLHGAPSLGLPIVDTTLWGGIFVTLVISIVGIVVSLPIGIVLAHGRR